MSDDREPSKDELLGALLWLRNHYEVGDAKLKLQVIGSVDAVLDKANVAVKHAASFREWRRRHGIKSE